MKKNILTTLVAALVYFLCIGVGVLLGNLVDHTGNMFYAPAFAALVGGSVYMILLAKVPRFGAITTIGLVISLFFLGSKHGAGAFLPGIVCGLAADGIAHLGHYKDKGKNLLSFLNLVNSSILQNLILGFLIGNFLRFSTGFLSMRDFLIPVSKIFLSRIRTLLIVL